MDWIAGIFELAGAWIVGNRNRKGFLVNVLCCLFWIYYVVKTNSAYGLLVVVVPSLFINIRNYILWKPDDIHGVKPVTLKDVLK
jgi:hypothetical protein